MPAKTVEPETSDLYEMKGKTRLLLWLPRILLTLALVLAVMLVFDRTFLLFRVLGAVMIPVSGLLLYTSGRPFGPVVVRALSQGSDLHFHCWDHKEVVIPRRGRALRKDPKRSNGALLLLRQTDGAGAIAFLKQDPGAMDLVADLEKRGVVRGPGESPKTPLFPQQQTSIKR